MKTNGSERGRLPGPLEAHVESFLDDQRVSVLTVIDGTAGTIIDGLGLCPRPRGFLRHGSGGR